jgi:hypothetical protein
MPLYKNCGWWKNFDCIFGFSVKNYVRNTINLSWDKILLTSVITPLFITQAPTCFGIHMPSSGSVLYPYELLERQKLLCCSHVL